MSVTPRMEVPTGTALGRRIPRLVSISVPPAFNSRFQLHTWHSTRSCNDLPIQIHSMLNTSSKYCPLWFPQYFNDTIIFFHKSRSRTNQKYIKWLPNLSCPNSKLSATWWSIFENCFDFQLLFPWHHLYLVTNHFWIIWVIKKSWRISSNGCFILKKQPNFSVFY